jgi:hypothetical protein
MAVRLIYVNAACHLCCVANKPFMLSVVRPNAAILSVMAPIQAIPNRVGSRPYRYI